MSVFLPPPLWTWALLAFLFLLLGFRFPLFLLPLWVRFFARFLVGVAGSTLFKLAAGSVIMFSSDRPRRCFHLRVGKNMRCSLCRSGLRIPLCSSVLIVLYLREMVATSFFGVPAHSLTKMWPSLLRGFVPKVLLCHVWTAFVSGTSGFHSTE